MLQQPPLFMTAVNIQYLSLLRSFLPSSSLTIDLCPLITHLPCFPFLSHSPSLAPFSQVLVIMVFLSWTINIHGNTFGTMGRWRRSAQWHFGHVQQQNKRGHWLHLSVCKNMQAGCSEADRAGDVGSFLALVLIQTLTCTGSSPGSSIFCSLKAEIS